MPRYRQRAAPCCFPCWPCAPARPSRPLAADAYPDKPIRLIVPYPRRRHRRDRPRAGPGADRRAGTDGGRGEPRGRGRQYRRRPGRQGAGRRLHPADGRADQPFDQCRLYRGRVTYDVEKSFAPVSIVGTVPLVFVVNPSVQATSLSQLIALAKSAGLHHHGLGRQRLAPAPGRRDVQARRQRGHPARAVQGQRPGHDRPDGRPGAEHDRNRARRPGQHQGRQLRALAVTSAERVPALPDTPTAAEAGLKDFEVSSMFGIVARRHPGAGRRASERRAEEDPGKPDEGLAAEPGRDRHLDHAGRRRRASAGRSALDQGDRRGRRQAGISGSPRAPGPAASASKGLQHAC